MVLLRDASWGQKQEGESGQRDNDPPPCAASPPSQPPSQPWQPEYPPWTPGTPLAPSPPPSPPPRYCPRLPPYPGVSSIQVMDCDVEFPEADVCGLSLLNGARLRLLPGQALAIRYRNLDSAAAPLSRLVISAERMTFNLLLLPTETAAGSASGSGPHRLLIVSGLCPDLPDLTACLHDAYHGVPQYRACGMCFGINMVSELSAGDADIWADGGGGGGYTAAVPLAGETSTRGDTSYFRSQLPAAGGGGSGDGGGGGEAMLLYFLASMSSDTVQLTYSRAARVLYMPGSRVSYLQPANRSFEGITGGSSPGDGPPGSAGGSKADGGTDGSSGDGSSSGGSTTDDSVTAAAELLPARASSPADSEGNNQTQVLSDDDGGGNRSGSNNSSGSSSDSSDSGGSKDGPLPVLDARPPSPPTGLSYIAAGGGAAAATARGIVTRWLLAAAVVLVTHPLLRSALPLLLLPLPGAPPLPP